MRWGHRIVIPSHLRTSVLQEFHTAYFDESAMRHQAAALVWWPKINEDIENYVAHCQPCQRNQNKPLETPILPWNIPAGVWERIHVDFAGPFEGYYWLVVVDAYSK